MKFVFGVAGVVLLFWVLESSAPPGQFCVWGVAFHGFRCASPVATFLCPFGAVFVWGCFHGFRFASPVATGLCPSGADCLCVRFVSTGFAALHPWLHSGAPSGLLCMGRFMNGLCCFRA